MLVKKHIAFLLLLYSIFVLTSCNHDTSQVSPFSVWNTAIEQNIEKTFASAFSANTKIQYADYVQALSQQELQQVKNIAINYYENEFSYDLLSLQTAENNCHWYSQYTQYQAGNIIIFKAETTHAGEGIYRYIIFVKNNANGQWEKIGEGY